MTWHDQSQTCNYETDSGCHTRCITMPSVNISYRLLRHSVNTVDNFIHVALLFPDWYHFLCVTDIKQLL